MSVREDLTTAAGHLAAQRRAVAARRDSLGDSVDGQRLRDDVVRRPDEELGPHRDLSRG